MAEFRVHMSAVASFSITVEAEDYDDAIEKAADRAPDVCAQCSGWGREYSLDLGESWEADSVDSGGAQVWESNEGWDRRDYNRGSGVSL